MTQHLQTLRLRLGDCVEVLTAMDESSIKAVVCDPPYGLEFMGKEWDKLQVAENPNFLKPPGVSGSNNTYGPRFGVRQHGDSKGVQKIQKRNEAQQHWHVRWLAEVYRVLEPGGVVKAFSGTRTFHRMAAAMEEAGFILEPKSSLEAWLYGSGFPKSMNISKQIDKQAGVDSATHKEVQVYLRAQRKKLGLSKAHVDQKVFGGTTRYSWVEGRGGQRAAEVYLPTPEEWALLKPVLQLDDRFDAYIQKAIPSRKDRFRADGGKAQQVGTEEGDWGYQKDGERWDGERRITAPATSDAQRWEGFGTALKPSWEPVIVGRKPK